MSADYDSLGFPTREYRVKVENEIKINAVKSSLDTAIELLEEVLEKYKKRELDFIREVVNWNQKEGWKKLLKEEIENYEKQINRLRSQNK